ncbi:MAG: acetoacetate decarboxylase family protein [Promethearchaeota archaeon]
MEDFNYQIDYSMPRQSGLYPPPPFEYQNARAIILVFQCAPNVKKKYLPQEFISIEGGLDALIILEYPQTSIGLYNECIVTLNCTYDNKPGLYVFSIYVDTDVALAAGREIWGIPKKLATIKLSQIKNNTVEGSVEREGIKLFEVSADVLNTEPGLNPKEMFETLPFYNLKLIPDIADNTKPALRQLTETTLKIHDIHKQYGADANYIKSNLTRYDISYELLKDANIELGGFYVDFDFTLPNGKILE